MTDRVVEIAETAARLSLENGLLKIRPPGDGSVTTVPVSEMQCLILANPAVTVTGALLSELAACGVMVVVSGKDRLPSAMQLPLVGNYVQTERFRAQIDASEPLRKRLWQTIVREKLRRQAELLRELRKSDFGLASMARLVRSGDPDNIEARAAAVYWKRVFPKPFQRRRDAGDSNVLLNYGYAVLRAMTARACCAAGLHPTLGVNHRNRYDPFCLADDLMEPFRVLVDRKVVELNPENEPVETLSREWRGALIQCLLERIPAGGETRKLSDLLRVSAGQVAESFRTGERALEYP